MAKTNKAVAIGNGGGWRVSVVFKYHNYNILTRYQLRFRSV